MIRRSRTTGPVGTSDVTGPRVQPYGDQGPRAAQAAAATGKWILEIVKRNKLHKFVVLPKRWIVERTFAWISRNRRLARDFERYATTVAAFIRIAMIRICCTA
jgi:putative transposase